MGEKIAYVMSRFPNLPETFILREMVEMENQGWQISLYPLIRQTQAVVHPDAECWLPRVRHSPFISWEVFRANLQAFLTKPFLYLYLLFTILRTNLRSPRFLARGLALFPKAVLAAHWMKTEGIRHIHVHYATHPALFAWIIHHFTGISYSVTTHAHDIYVNTTMLREKLRSAAFVIAISKFNRKLLLKQLNHELEKKLHVVHCGIYPEKYIGNRRLKEAGAPLRLVSVGSLEAYKGHSYLIQAAKILQDSGLSFSCTIIGSGAQKASLEELIRLLGLEDRVVLAGPRTEQEVAEFLNGADIYVHPSVILPDGKMEGLPVAIMEALAAGLPAIGTSISGVPEILRDLQTGFLVPPEDPLALAEKILFLAGHPEAATRIAENGRMLVQMEFDLRKNVQQLSNLMAAALIASEPGSQQPAYSTSQPTPTI